MLAHLGTEQAPLPLVGVQAPPAPAAAVTTVGPASARPSRAPAWILSATAVTAVAAGSILGALATSDANAAHSATFSSDRQSLNTSASNKALAANICFGGAVALGAGAGILFWRSW